MAASPFEIVADGLRVAVRLTPKSTRAAIAGIAADADGRAFIAVRVTAPPADGRANAALIKLLAKEWRLPASRMAIVSGPRDRRKVVHIAGEGATLLAAVSGRIAPAAGGEAR